MNQKLIDLVIEEIIKDLEAGDITALEVLLSNSKDSDLKAFLRMDTLTNKQKGDL